MSGATRALGPRNCWLCGCDRPGARALQARGASPSTSGGFCTSPHSTRIAECEVARLSFSWSPVERCKRSSSSAQVGAQGKRDNISWDDLGQVTTVSTSAPRRMISRRRFLRCRKQVQVLGLYEIKILDIVPLSCLEARGKHCHSQRRCAWVRSKPKSSRPRQGLTSKFEAV